MCCTLESTLSHKELFLEQALYIAVVRKKKWRRKRKIGQQVFLYMFYPFLLLRSREAGYQLKELLYDCNESVGIYPACVYCPG